MVKKAEIAPEKTQKPVETGRAPSLQGAAKHKKSCKSLNVPLQEQKKIIKN